MAQHAPTKATSRKLDDEGPNPMRAEAIAMRRIVVEQGRWLSPLLHDLPLPVLTEWERTVDLSKLDHNAKTRQLAADRAAQSQRVLDKVDNPQRHKGERHRSTSTATVTDVQIARTKTPATRSTLQARKARQHEVAELAKAQGKSPAEVERELALARVNAIAAQKAADEAQVMMAAELCKADLTSGMVGEFPEVQGIMGRYYALGEKLPAAVADAIGDHYAPAGPNDRCPSAPVSIAVALADKLDALVSFWSIGEKPTGSRDPYALRRAALGVIRIVVENRLRLPLKNFFQQADLLDFFAERLKVQMREKGVRHDVVDAVLALGSEDDLVRLLARVEAVQGFLASEDGRNLLTAYGRAANIVRAEEKKDKALAAKIAAAPETGLLEQAEEKAVAQALTGVKERVGPALQKEDFSGAMKAFAGLRAPLDTFFDKVTVNVTDKPDLRLNRLRLLNQIRATMDSVADFSKIEG